MDGRDRQFLDEVMRGQWGVEHWRRFLTAVGYGMLAGIFIVAVVIAGLLMFAGPTR